MSNKKKKTSHLNWIEMIRVRSTALMLEESMETIQLIVKDMDDNIRGAHPFFMQHALYDGDLAVVIIWNNSLKPEKSREGLMLVNRLEKLGAVDHAVWIPTGKIPGKNEIE